MCSTRLSAQYGIADTTISVVLIDFAAGYHVPGGDLADRFGSNGAMGGGVRLKLSNGFVFGLHGSFLFGSEVNQTVATGIRNSDGFIIDDQGRFVQLLTLQRGLTTTAQVGRLFKAFGPNPNSGFLLQIGGGLLQHKIRLESRNNDAPAIEGELLKGYDRLTNGFTLHESFGYQILSSNKLVNIYFGIEAYHAWTQSRRAFNIDDMAKDVSKRKDSLYGLKLIWSFPIYGRNVQGEYYR